MLLRAMLILVRARYCRHECALIDVERVNLRTVQAPCLKCGSVLDGTHGLDLPCVWREKKDHEPRPQDPTARAA